MSSNIRIDVNRNLDEYKDDFFKGLTLKQTVCAASALILGSGIYLASLYLFHIPDAAAMYLVIPVVLPVVLAGFLQIQGMPLLRYLLVRMDTLRQPVYYYMPDILRMEDHSTEAFLHSATDRDASFGEEGENDVISDEHVGS